MDVHYRIGILDWFEESLMDIIFVNKEVLIGDVL